MEGFVGRCIISRSLCLTADIRIRVAPPKSSPTAGLQIRSDRYRKFGIVEINVTISIILWGE